VGKVWEYLPSDTVVIEAENAHCIDHCHSANRATNRATQGMNAITKHVYCPEFTN